MDKKSHLPRHVGMAWCCCLSMALVFFFVMLSNTYGTVLKKMSARELTDNSNAIVVGKVKSVKSQWGDDGTKIYTYITVSVERSIKGTLPSSEITIRQLGGEVGGVGLKVVGAPEYREGEEIFTFLKECDSNHFQCVGMVQGKYSIKTDEVTRKKILIREIDKFDKKKPDLRTPKDVERKLFLDDFINQIEAIVNEKKSER